MSRNSQSRNYSDLGRGDLPPLEEGDHDGSNSIDHNYIPGVTSVPLPRPFSSAGAEKMNRSTDFQLPLSDAEDGSTKPCQEPPQSAVSLPPLLSTHKAYNRPLSDKGGTVTVTVTSPRIFREAKSRDSIKLSGSGSSDGMSSSSVTISGEISLFNNANRAFRRGSKAFRSSLVAGKRRGSLLRGRRNTNADEGFFSASNSAILASVNSERTVQKRSSLARKNNTTVAYMSRMVANQIYRGYSIGDYALVMGDAGSSSSVPNKSEERGGSLSQEDSEENTVLLNKQGYPQGKGKHQHERNGPYLYVLCTVVQPHYEENEVYWTVSREDNRQDIRGEARYMEPISSQEGLLAAQQAAVLTRTIAEGGDENEDTKESKRMRGFLGCLSSCLCITCCLPLFCIYESLRMLKTSKGYKALLHHAKMFLNGREPYKISFRITTVNVIVVCSIWYLFIDQIRLAFLPPSADGALAWVNFVVWMILVMELVFGVFVRPDGWHSLVRSDKAYTPQTARYINGIHLVVESISLLLFVPVFYCIFSDEHTCSSRIPFSFLEASLASVLGPSLSGALYGRLLYGIVRFRVFALVRHWRNAWLNNTFLNYRERKSVRERRRGAFLNDVSDDTSTSTMYTSGEYEHHLVPYGESEYSDNRSHQQDSLILEEQDEKDREEAKVKASNIGTALMTVNSHRTLFLFCFLTACFPMLFLFNMQNVVNPASEEMVEYLQAINLQVAGNDSSINCDYLFHSVEAWSKAMVQFDPSVVIPHGNITHQNLDPEPTGQLISVSIRPPRCYDNFNNKTIGYLTFHVGDNCTSWSWADEDYTGGCIYGTLLNISNSTNSLLGVASNLSLRVGSMKTFEATNQTFAVSATYNLTRVVRFGARFSFFLEILLLAIIIGMLNVFRHDTVDLVFGSLRSMLRIILRYAKNPLSPPGKNKDTSGIGMGEDDDQLVQTYETEQLVKAVSKITDLLRKCWGVAGADIISTNLASRDGHLKVFNPTVPGRNVFALFAFAAITDFDYALKNLGGDVMILINDVASVLHGEVYRWGLGDSGQCNRNLGSAFFIVFKIGSVMEVVENFEEATQVVFSTAAGRKATKARYRSSLDNTSHPPIDSNHNSPKTTSDYVKGLKTVLRAEKYIAMEAMAEAMQLSLEQIPGISGFADRAVIGMLKSFASIHNDTQLRAWSRDFRLREPTARNENPWSVNMIFGMDAGWAVEGAVGSEYKIDATYLSPHVNMSSQMMSACKQYGVNILLSEAVHTLLSAPAKTKMRNLDRVTVKGSSKVQNIYTYDARKGAYIFLNWVSDEQADHQAKNYEPNIWNVDMELRDMRHHITEDFEQEFKAGIKAYYDGDWPTAIEKLEHANDVMVETAVEEDDLRDTMNEFPERKVRFRKEKSDPPSMYLINFMKSKGGKAPDDWEGWHPLMTK